MVLITPMLALQIAGFATKIGAVALEKSNPKVAENLALLSQLVAAGTQTAGQIGKAGASPNIAQTQTSTEGSGLQIGGLTGKIADYTSKMPGVQGFGKGNSIFDPNFNTNQLGIQSPYNNTPDYLNFLGG